MANKKGNVVKSAQTYQREERSSDKKPVSHGQLAEFIKIQNRNLQDFVSETKENKREEQEQDEDMDTDEDDSDECDDDGVLESDNESVSDGDSIGSLSGNEL